MKRAVITTMDAAGRLVLPKDVRDEAELAPGMKLAIVCRDGRVEIEPAPREVHISRNGRLSVAVPAETSGPLTVVTVRKTTTAVRNRQR